MKQTPCILVAAVALLSMASQASAVPVTSGLVMWFDGQDINGDGTADAGIPLGTQVTSWNSKAGTAVASASTVGRIPVIGNFSGSQVVQFDGNDFMSITGSPASHQTAFFVYNNTSTAAWSTPLGTLHSSVQSYHGNDNDSGVFDSVFTDAATRNGATYRQGGVSVNGLTTPRPDAMTIDAHVATGVMTRAVTVLGMDNCIACEGGVRGINGQIAEVILYDRALSVNELNQVGNYLEVKYGLAWNDIGQSVAWTSTGPTAGNWTDISNWASGAGPIPGSTSTTDNPDIFTNNTGVTAQTINVDSNRNLKDITLQWTANNGGKTFTGGSLKLTSGGTLQKATGGGAHTNTFETPIEIQGDGGSYTFANNSSVANNILNIGNVSGVSTSGNTTTLTLTGTNVVNQGGTNTIQGVISDGTSGGKLAIVKNNLNTWILNGANTYTANTTINGGTLQLGNGGTTGSLSPSSTIVNNGTFAINRSDAVEQGTHFAGGISGSGLLLKSGAGTLTLTTMNSYSGGTTVSAGSVVMTAHGAIGTGALSVANGAILDMGTFNASIVGPNHFITGGTINGSGVLTFTGDMNLGYLNSVAATTINAQLSGTGKVRHVAGTNTVVHLTNPNNNYSGGTDIGGSNIGLTSFVSGALGSTGNITFTGSVGALQWAAGNTQDISGRIVINPGVNAQFDTNGNNVTFANSLGSSTGGFTKHGAGLLTLSTAPSALTGSISLSNGGLVLRNVNTGTAGTLTINNTSPANGWLDVGTGAAYAFTSVSVTSGNNAYTPGLHQVGGTLTTSGAFTLSGGFDSSNPGSGRFSYVSGGTLNIGTTLRIGNGNEPLTGGSGGNFNNHFIISGGDVSVGTTLNIGHFSTAGAGLNQLIMSGGTLISTGAVLVRPGTNQANVTNLILGGGTTTVNDTGVGVQLGAGAGVGNGRVFLSGDAILEAHKVTKQSVTTTNANYNTVYFNGGTLRALSTNNVDFLGELGTPAGGNTSLGNSTSNAAFIFSGGATIDTNGFDVTVNPALLARVGANTNSSIDSVSGLNAGNSGANYAIAPNVSFTGGGGSGAVGYATLDSNGGIAAIVITDPGTGYTSSPTVALAGGTLLAGTGVAATPTGWMVNLRGSTAGGLTKTGLGTATLASAASTYTGATTINQGVLSISNLANGGVSSSLGISSNAASNLVLGGGTLEYTGGAVSTDRLFSVGTSGGTIEANGSGAVNFTNTGAMGFNGQAGARTLTLAGSNAGANTLAALIGDNGGPTTLVKNGAGSWTLSSNHNYTGNTIISQGTLALAHANNNNIAASPVISIASGAFLDTSGLGSAVDLVLASGQTLQGTGTVLGNLTVSSGSTLKPGNSPGTLNQVGNQTWNPGGQFLFEINDATGTAGADPGWNLMAIAGSLDVLTLSAGSEFEVIINSLELSNAAGDAENFDASMDYAWLFADATSPIVGFTGSDQFLVLDAAFTNPFTGTFSVVLGDTVPGGDSSQLYIQYLATPVPEPGSILVWAVALVGIAVIARQRMRCRR